MFKSNQLPTKVAVWTANFSLYNKQLNTPTRIALPKGDPIHYFALRNKVAFAISYRGEAYVWGALSTNGDDENAFLSKNLNFLLAEPKSLTVLKGIQISSLSCNNSVVIFLSKDGALYSYGNDLGCRFGLLGLGEVYHQASPCPISALLDHRIKQVSVGYSHVCALNHTGCLFTWGTGKKGQLGIKDKEKVTIPTLIECAKVISARQALSSYNSTTVLSGTIFQINVLGGGYVYIYGSLKQSTKFLAKSSSTYELQNKTHPIHEPLQIEKLSNAFITKISLGEGFITCLSKNGEVYWVTGDLAIYKMNAKKPIKDIICLDNKAYGMTEDGAGLYEWKPIIDEKKTSDFYKIPTYNFTTNIYQLNNDNSEFTGFCDLPSAGINLSMYFIDNVPETKPPESKQLKTIAKMNPDEFASKTGRKNIREESAERTLKSKDKGKMLFIGTKMKHEEDKELKERDARFLFKDVYVSNKRDVVKAGGKIDAREEFKAGVGAFKSYLQAKRSGSMGPISPTSSMMSQSRVAIKLLEYPMEENASNMFSSTRELREQMEKRKEVMGERNQVTKEEEKEPIREYTQRNNLASEEESDKGMMQKMKMLNLGYGAYREDRKDFSRDYKFGEREDSKTFTKSLANRQDKKARLEGIAKGVKDAAEKIKALRRQNVEHKKISPESDKQVTQPIEIDIRSEVTEEIKKNNEEKDQSITKNEIEKESDESINQRDEDPNSTNQQDQLNPERLAKYLLFLEAKLNIDNLKRGFRRIIKCAEKRELHSIVQQEVKKSKKPDAVNRIANTIKKSMLRGGWQILATFIPERVAESNNKSRYNSRMLLESSNTFQKSMKEPFESPNRNLKEKVEKLIGIIEKLNKNIIMNSLRKLQEHMRRISMIEKGLNKMSEIEEKNSEKKVIERLRMVSKLAKAAMKLAEIPMHRELLSVLHTLKDYSKKTETRKVKCQTGIKLIIEPIRRRLNSYVAKLKHNLALKSAKIELKRVHDEYLQEQEKQMASLNQKDCAIQELQSNLSKLSGYKTALQTVSLKHLFTIMVHTCGRILKNHYTEMTKSLKLPEKNEDKNLKAFESPQIENIENEDDVNERNAGRKPNDENEYTESPEINKEQIIEKENEPEIVSTPEQQVDVIEDIKDKVDQPLANIEEKEEIEEKKEDADKLDELEEKAGHKIETEESPEQKKDTEYNIVGIENIGNGEESVESVQKPIDEIEKVEEVQAQKEIEEEKKEETAKIEEAPVQQEEVVKIEEKKEQIVSDQTINNEIVEPEIKEENQAIIENIVEINKVEEHKLPEEIKKEEKSDVIVENKTEIVEQKEEAKRPQLSTEVVVEIDRPEVKEETTKIIDNSNTQKEENKSNKQAILVSLAKVYTQARVRTLSSAVSSIKDFSNSRKHADYCSRGYKAALKIIARIVKDSLCKDIKSIKGYATLRKDQEVAHAEFEKAAKIIKQSLIGNIRKLFESLKSGVMLRALQGEQIKSKEQENKKKESGISKLIIAFDKMGIRPRWLHWRKFVNDLKNSEKQQKKLQNLCKVLNSLYKKRVQDVVDELGLFARTKQLLLEKEKELTKMIEIKDSEYKAASEQHMKSLKEKEVELQKAKERESAIKFHNIILKRIKSYLEILKLRMVSTVYMLSEAVPILPIHEDTSGINNQASLLAVEDVYNDSNNGNAEVEVEADMNFPESPKRETLQAREPRPAPVEISEKVEPPKIEEIKKEEPPKIDEAKNEEKTEPINIEAKKEEKEVEMQKPTQKQEIEEKKEIITDNVVSVNNPVPSAEEHKDVEIVKNDANVPVLVPVLDNAFPSTAVQVQEIGKVPVEEKKVIETIPEMIEEKKLYEELPKLHTESNKATPISEDKKPEESEKKQKSEETIKRTENAVKPFNSDLPKPKTNTSITAEETKKVKQNENEVSLPLQQEKPPLPKKKIPTSQLTKFMTKPKTESSKKQSAKYAAKDLLEPEMNVQLMQNENSFSSHNSAKNQASVEDPEEKNKNLPIFPIAPLTPSSEYAPSDAIHTEPVHAEHTSARESVGQDSGRLTPSRNDTRFSKFNTAEMIVLPENFPIDKSRLSGEENSAIGMADPVELETMSWSNKSSSPNVSGKIEDDHLQEEDKEVLNKNAGRYDHKKFMQAFSTCFMKYHNQMIEEEKASKRASPALLKQDSFPESPIHSPKSVEQAFFNITKQKDMIPFANKDELPKVSSEKEFQDLLTRMDDEKEEEDKNNVLQEQKEEENKKEKEEEKEKPVSAKLSNDDISKIFKERMKKMKQAKSQSSKFVNANKDSVRELSNLINAEKNASVRSDHPRGKAASRSRQERDIELATFQPSTGSFKQSKGRNPMGANKKFIEELSNINHELNAPYDNVAHLPRFKIPNPDQLMKKSKNNPKKPNTKSNKAQPQLAEEIVNPEQYPEFLDS